MRYMISAFVLWVHIHEQGHTETMSEKWTIKKFTFREAV